MAKKRKIRDQEDARRCLAAARAAGQGRSEWARQHGVDGRSLYGWEKKLEPDGAEPQAKRRGLVELIPDARRPVARRFVVRCGRLAVEVDDHFDEAALGRLLRVVATC